MEVEIVVLFLPAGTHDKESCICADVIAFFRGLSLLAACGKIEEVFPPGQLIHHPVKGSQLVEVIGVKG